MSQFISNLENYPQMHFEFAALHGEMYRIYQRIEDSRNKSLIGQLITEEVGTTGDRMVHACLLVALAALPKLAQISEAYHDGDQPGVFTYDHIEMSGAALKRWENSPTLPAYLFKNLSLTFWYEAAENNRIDVSLLGGHIHAWALENVGAWAQKHFQDEPGVQRQGGAEEWAPDDQLTADQLRQKYYDEEGGEHVDYVRQMWRHQVLELSVISGYWDWVFNCIQEAKPDPAQCNKRLQMYVSKDPSRCVTLIQVEPGLFRVERGQESMEGDLAQVGSVFGMWLTESLTCDGLVELA